MEIRQVIFTLGTGGVVYHEDESHWVVGRTLIYLQYKTASLDPFRPNMATRKDPFRVDPTWQHFSIH